MQEALIPLGGVGVGERVGTAVADGVTAAVVELRIGALLVLVTEVGLEVVGSGGTSGAFVVVVTLYGVVGELVFFFFFQITKSRTALMPAS